MSGEVLRLAIDGDAVSGELVLDVAPGTRKEARDQALDALLGRALESFARENGLVLAAAPRAFAFELSGRDAERRTRFEIRGRVEGEILVPRRPERTSARKRRA